VRGQFRLLPGGFGCFGVCVCVGGVTDLDRISHKAICNAPFVCNYILARTASMHPTRDTQNNSTLWSW
jgi:hypothetical protein